MKKRALLSVYNKDGVLPFARSLAELGWELLSTGGTAKFLRDNSLPVIDVSEITGFPECLDGRVKTLHPAVHAGILARRNEKSHVETLKNLNIGTIDLVAVNLYPFFEKVGAGLPTDETIEFIDIGGPTMLRSAAKNYHDVIVLTDPSDYEPVIAGLNGAGLSDEARKRLAGKVFNLTSAYDAAIARYLLPENLPPFYELPLKKAQLLKYGENAHQKAGLYLNADIPGALGSMEQLGGKEMGYNNLRDIDLAWKAVCAFGLKSDGVPAVGSDMLDDMMENVPLTENTTCCVAVKHNTPCGISAAATLGEAFSKTYSCDPVSIFGGIVACNTKIDAEIAEKLDELFLEIVIAPDFEPKALEILRSKKDLRIIKAKRAPREPIECVSVDGGMLVQEVNHGLLAKWDVVTKTPVDPADIADMIFGVRAVSWVKSNAIVVVKNQAAVGIGGGETNRIWAAELALNRAARCISAAAEVKSSRTIEGGLSPKLAKYLPDTFYDAAPARVLASDAFFPFPDIVEAAAAAGIKAIIQSGGSNNDKLSIEACDRLGISMVFTGTRYFKH